MMYFQGPAVASDVAVFFNLHPAGQIHGAESAEGQNRQQETNIANPDCTCSDVGSEDAQPEE